MVAITKVDTFFFRSVYVIYGNTDTCFCCINIILKDPN